MNSKHLTLIGCLVLAMISCDKITNKSDRSSGGEAPLEQTPADGADATVAEGEDPATPVEDKVDPAMALTGKDLYAKLCASCHQELEKSDIGKTSLSKLKAAIASVPTMAGLKDTSDKDLEAIVAALSQVSPGKGKGKAGAEEAEGEE